MNTPRPLVRASTAGALICSSVLLGKLCKSVSLKPLKKQGWFARATKSQRHDETEDEIQTLLLRRYPLGVSRPEC
jgi:hypothetical protein